MRVGSIVPSAGLLQTAALGRPVGRDARSPAILARRALMRIFLPFAAAFALAAASAAAHGPAAWIQNGHYRNLTGTREHCCGPNDCAAYNSSDVQVRPDGYMVRPAGVLVPTDQAQFSEDDKYWLCRKPDGSMRCFFIPNVGA
jgi:hypothetical protein